MISLNGSTSRLLRSLKRLIIVWRYSWSSCAISSAVLLNAMSSGEVSNRSIPSTDDDDKPKKNPFSSVRCYFFLWLVFFCYVLFLLQCFHYFFFHHCSTCCHQTFPRSSQSRDINHLGVTSHPIATIAFSQFWDKFLMIYDSNRNLPSLFILFWTNIRILCFTSVPLPVGCVDGVILC